MIIILKCDFCCNSIVNAFVGKENEKKVFSCFKCFLKTLIPFSFDEELVYYPLFGIREIQLEDSVVFYDGEGQKLAKVHLKSYEEGFLSFLKKEIADDSGLLADDITLVIDPYDIQIRE